MGSYLYLLWDCENMYFQNSYTENNNFGYCQFYVTTIKLIEVFCIHSE